MRSRFRRAAAPRLALLLLCALLGWSADTAVCAPPEPLGVPEGPPVQLDGRVAAAEWEGALVLPLGADGTRLQLRQRRGTLLIAFESPQAWAPRSTLTLFFSPDGEAAGVGAPGAVRIDYEPLEHNRPHVIATRNGDGRPEPVTEQIVARRTLAPQACGIEMAFSVGLLGVTADDRAPRRLCVLWARPDAGGSLTWPADIDLVSQPGRVPEALARATAWGRLEGWGDPAGPGAFPPSAWKTWVDHDRELARRGATAHATVRELLEEWKATKKQDGEQGAEVLENLAWIARHEELTPNDLLAQATTLRFLNRNHHALGVLDALVQHPDAAVARRALYQRAQTHESMERFAAAEADWADLAGRVAGPYRAAYEVKAQGVHAKIERHAEEEQARAEDDVHDDLPLVALHTSRGLIVLQLFAHDVPVAVKHFLDLVDAKFYDGTLFHRVIGDFMAQGGDPISRDQGCEFAGRGTSPTEVEMEINERHGFWRGAVGFARKMRESNGSQFFLMTAPRPDLGDYTCFGRVVSGMEHVERLELCDTLHKAVVLRR